MKIFLILLPLLFTACSISKKDSPVIYFSNASSEMIKNINCEWVDNNLTLNSLEPGDSRSQSFRIRSASDFFGSVKVSWVNAKGDEVRKEFYFKDNNLPSFSDHTTYNYVQFYFDQSGLEVVSSDAPDLSGKTQRMDQILNAYRNQFLHGTVAKVPESSLISVKPVKDHSLPSWLSNSY